MLLSPPVTKSLGVYFDVVIRNTTSFFIALHNAPSNTTPSTEPTEIVSAPTPLVNPGHLSFHPLSASEKPAAPVSLLVRIDMEEYIILPNSTSLVAVCSQSLSPDRAYNIRVVAPMVDDNGDSVVELEGLWLSKGGSFDQVAGSMLINDYAVQDDLQAESSIVGGKHQEGIADFQEGDFHGLIHSHKHHQTETELMETINGRRKVVEIVTDSPGSLTRKRNGDMMGSSERLLAGVMGWEYLIGDMFDSDHVCIGVDGMCLTQNCHGGKGFPAGIGDVFFRRWAR